MVAFRLPNLFRSVFAEGFNDAVATPVLSEYNTDKTRLFEISNRLLCIFVVTLSLATLLGILFSKYLVTFIAPGFTSNPYKFELTISFTRITFFYLFLIGISSSITSALYALKRFFIPAINPIFLNITFIPGILFFSNYFKNYILVACVIVAGILEVVFPYISLKREGFSLKISLRDLRDSFKDSAIIKMLRLFVPRIWSSIIYHLNVFVDTIFSSLSHIVGSGAVAAVYYANRLIQFPFALIALSIAPVVVVDLSSYHKQGNRGDFKRLFVFSFQNIIFFILPISFIFLAIPDAIIDVLFRRGEFTVDSLRITSRALFFYAFGLFFYCGIKLLVTSFYSLKDTITPAKTATVSLIVNVFLSGLLMFPLQIGGVALGTSLAALCNFFLLYRHLVRKIGAIEWEDTKSEFIKVLSLSLSVALVSRLVWNTFTIDKYFKFFLVCLIAVLAFIMGGFLLRIKQVRYVWQWFLRKK